MILAEEHCCLVEMSDFDSCMAEGGSARLSVF
jgi:hypothetical protein